MSFEKSVRSQFPILERKIRDKDLVYLDSAASTLKPMRVVQKVSDHLLFGASNIHRGVHFLAEKATEEFEQTRVEVKNFINASSVDEIIFTSGTTDGLNLVTQSFGRSVLTSKDTVVLTELEHHSNIVPWYILQKELKFQIKIIPVKPDGSLDLEVLKQILEQYKPKILSLNYVSNTLGTINPLADIIKLAKESSIYVVVDAAQAAANLPVDVQKLDCDFFAFSGHKLFGPTGVGVLYGKREHLELMPPWKGGGDMIKSVSFERIIYNDIPHKFEAGTSPIAEVIGLGEAIRFVNEVGFKNILQHEQTLLTYGTTVLEKIPGLRIIGKALTKVPIFSFLIDGIHPQDLSVILDQEGVAVRTGNHCTEPLLKALGLPQGTVRASCSIYSTKQDLDLLVNAIYKAKGILE